MKEKLKRLLEFVKGHKTELIIGAGATTIAVSLWTREGKRIEKAFPKDEPKPVLIPKTYEVGLGIGSGPAEILSEDKYHKALFVNGLTIDDVGALGEKLREAYPDIPEHHDNVAVDIFICGLDKTK